jgi:hypothetical protein
MMLAAKLSSDGGTITIKVPLAIRQRGGVKQVIAPTGASDWAPHAQQVEGTLVKAIARGFRWRRLLEDGAYGTIAELAAAEKISPSYLSRVLRLTLLAPEIVRSILDGRQSPELTLPKLLEPFPVDWDGQYRAFGPI